MSSHNQSRLIGEVTSAMGSAVRKVHYGAIALAGLSFWFFLGFPFGNHNESYLWVAELRSMTFGEALTHKLGPVINHRPLGQAIAWLGYRLSGGQIYPVELFNYFVAVAAWVVLLMAVKDKRVFSVVCLTVGGCFFSGYIYLFHLHGVFYSPLLSLLSLYLYTSINMLYSRSMSIVCYLQFCCTLFIHFQL